MTTDKRSARIIHKFTMDMAKELMERKKDFVFSPASIRTSMLKLKDQVDIDVQRLLADAFTSPRIDFVMDLLKERVIVGRSL